jgi:hypothetical protein
MSGRNTPIVLGVNKKLKAVSAGKQPLNLHAQVKK